MVRSLLVYIFQFITFLKFQDAPSSECLSIENEYDCDQFIDEECEYSGNTIIRTPAGTITNPDECQEICANNQENVLTTCEYWIYDKTERVCTLLDSSNYTCKSESGQQAPYYDDCLDSFELAFENYKMK